MTEPNQATIEILLAETAWVRTLAARLTGSVEEAEDLVQETWVAALRRPPEEGRPVRPWLATVLRNTVRARFRKRQARSAREEGRAREEGGMPAPEEWLERLESQELVSRLVRELPEAEREIVLLRYHEELPLREIAARVGSPPGTVRWRLKAALDTLRTRLDHEYDGDRTAWMTALVPLVRTHGRHAAGASAVAGSITAWLALTAKFAAIVALLGGAAWLLQRGSEEGAPAPRLAALTPQATSPTTREVEPSAPVQEGSARVALPAGEERDDDPLAGRPRTRARLRVVDQAGVPVVGARVEVIPGLRTFSLVEDLLRSMPPQQIRKALFGHSVETDAGGFATLETRLLLESSEVSLRAEGPDFGRWSDSFLVQPGVEQDLGEIVLTPGGLVAYRVLDTSGEPVEAQVTVGSADLAEDETTTRDRGPRESHAWTAGRSTGVVFVDREGTFRLWAQTAKDRPWGWSEPFALAFGKRCELELRVDPPPPPIVLRVIGPDGDPRPCHVELRADGGTGLSTEDGDGELELGSSFPPGEPLNIEIRDRAQALAPLRSRLEDPRGVVVLQLRPAPVVNRTLIVRSTTGAPLEGAVARIHARGTYLTRGITDGSVELVLPGGEGERFDLQVREKEHVLVELEELVARELPADWVVQLAPLPGITGLVTFADKPVAGAEIRVSHRCEPGEWQRRQGGVAGVRWGSGSTTQSGADGRFRVPLQYAGNWVLRARAPGLADALIDLDSYDPGRGALDLELELTAPGAVEGLVLDAEGLPLPRQQVALSHPVHEQRTTRTDRLGRYSLEGLPPGDWYVSAPMVELGGRGYEVLGFPESWCLPSNVHVTSGATIQHVIRRPQQRHRTGRIELGPLATANPTLAQGWGLLAEWDGIDAFLEHPDTRADVAEDGSFLLPLVDEGTWKLVLGGRAFTGEATWTLDTTAPGEPLVLVMPLARLSGRLTGAEDLTSLELELGDDSPFDYRAECPLGEGGSFGPVVVPAGELSIVLPSMLPVSIPDLDTNPESLSDLVDQAILEGVLSAALSGAATRTKVRVVLSPGAKRFVELP